MLIIPAEDHPFWGKILAWDGDFINVKIPLMVIIYLLLILPGTTVPTNNNVKFDVDHVTLNLTK